MLKDLISVSIFVSEHLRLSANNGVGCVWFSFPWIISPIALMIAQRLASDGCREQYLSLSISLSLCSGAWHYECGLSGGGTPFVVRKSMSQSLASVNVCVCLCVRMKTRWHRREGRADWSQQGEASGIITDSVRSGDTMSPYPSSSASLSAAESWPVPLLAQRGRVSRREQGWSYDLDGCSRRISRQ